MFWSGTWAFVDSRHAFSKSSRQSTSSISVPVNEYPKSLEIKEVATPIDRDSEYFWMPIVYLMFIDFEATNNFCQPCAAFFRLQVKIPYLETRWNYSNYLDGEFSSIFTMKLEIWMDFIFTIVSPYFHHIFTMWILYFWIIGVFRIFHVPSMQKQISDLHRGQLRVITEAGSGRGVELWHQAPAKNTDSYSHMKYVGYLWFMEHIYGTYIWNIYMEHIWKTGCCFGPWILWLSIQLGME